MGLGLLILVSTGKENLYFSSQPDITFFKIAYRRYTNFSIEAIQQYFKTTPDFGRRCTINIGKNADLMGMTYLYVELPQISSINSSKFAWTEKIGLALINFIEIEIEGNIIDRHYGDWINIWLELITSDGHKKSINKMIGNVSELTNFSNNKRSMKLYIPLCFWYCLDSGLALPLIALAHNDIKLHIEFNDISLCYNISPSYYIKINENFCLLNNGELFYQYNQNNKIIGQFISFDEINQYLYYNPIKDTFIVPLINNDPSLQLIGIDSNFIMNITINSVVVQNNNYFKFTTPSLINSYLLVNYIYLDNYERVKFLNNSHEYIIPIVQYLPEKIINSTNSIYKLPLINPVKLLVWRCILALNKNLNNIFNYTCRPYINEDNLIYKNLLIINSINRIDLNSIQYYTSIQKYQNDFNNNQKGIYMYSFSLYPKDIQPSGTLNFSKIDDAYIQLTMNKIINYQNPVYIKAYAIQYNLFKTKNGIGGLVFNI